MSLPAVVPPQRPLVPQSEGDWEPHKSKIHELYQSKTLKEVSELMLKEENFKATTAQYKKRLQKWGFDNKRIKGEQYLEICKKLKRRAEDEPEKESLVLLNNVPVKKEKIERYQVRAQKRGVNIPDGPQPDDQMRPEIQVITPPPSPPPEPEEEVEGDDEKPKPANQTPGSESSAIPQRSHDKNDSRNINRYLDKFPGPPGPATPDSLTPPSDEFDDSDDSGDAEMWSKWVDWTAGVSESDFQTFVDSESGESVLGLLGKIAKKEKTGAAKNLLKIRLTATGRRCCCSKVIKMIRYKNDRQKAPNSPAEPDWEEPAFVIDFPSPWCNLGKDHKVHVAVYIAEILYGMRQYDAAGKLFANALSQIRESDLHHVCIDLETEYLSEDELSENPDSSDELWSDLCSEDNYAEVIKDCKSKDSAERRLSDQEINSGPDMEELNSNRCKTWREMDEKSESFWFCDTGI